jgi:ABC-type transporter Mla subunit MlaD
MDKTQYEIELETVLVNLLQQLQEDIPVDAWSKHLNSAVRDAYDLLAETGGNGE